MKVFKPNYMGLACVDAVSNRPDMYKFRLFKHTLNNSFSISSSFSCYCFFNLIFSTILPNRYTNFSRVYAQIPDLLKVCAY
jgi:hypothetical protein